MPVNTNKNLLIVILLIVAMTITLYFTGSRLYASSDIDTDSASAATKDNEVYASTLHNNNVEEFYPMGNKYANTDLYPKEEKSKTKTVYVNQFQAYAIEKHNEAIEKNKIEAAKKAEAKRQAAIKKQTGYTHVHLETMWLKNVSDPSGKTYEPYYMITDPSSKQYAFQQQSNVGVDSRGYLMEDGMYYAVAMGTYFGPIGTKYIITLDTGKTIKVVKGDNKADCDTDSDNYAAKTGHILEFMINPHSSYMVQNNIAYHGNLNRFSYLNGSIVKIQKVVND